MKYKYSNYINTTKYFIYFYTMKNILIIVSVAFFVCSCSPDWHIRRAKFKQPNILQQFNDTIRMKNIRIDTIYFADTFAIVHTLTEYDTIIQTRYLKPQTRYEIKWKYRTIRDTVRIKERTQRIETRQENRTDRTKSRRLWWLYMLIGAVIGIVIYRKI